MDTGGICEGYGQVQQASRTPGRFATIDGLRGIAAMSVVFYHLYGHLKEAVADWLPHFIAVILGEASVGIEVFFVISGFVIAHTISPNKVTGSFVARFALRRSLRLDPPYWVSIGVAISMTFLSNQLFNGIFKPLPDAKVVFAHMLYLQDLLGFGNIVAVYWTLCLEVQFYLFFALLLNRLQHYSRTDDTVTVLAHPAAILLFSSLVLLSLLDKFHLWMYPLRGFFLPYWHVFFLGAVTYWVVSGWLRPRYLLLYLILVTGFAIAFNPNTGSFVALVTAAFIYLVGIRGRLGDILGGRVLQYLGRISYSLYLFHAIIGWSTVSLCERYLGHSLGVFAGTFSFLAGVAASVIAAHIAYILIEKPSIELSKLLKSSWPSLRQAQKLVEQTDAGSLEIPKPTQVPVGLSALPGQDPGD